MAALYYVKFDVDKALDLEQRFTMNFNRTENIDEVMAVISRLSNHFQYHKHGNIIKLYKKRKEAAPSSTDT